MKIKPYIHYVPSYLIQPANPVTVNLIGSGRTGSRVLTALAETNHSLIELGYPGLHVQLFDNDIVTEANLGTQRFATAELGFKKCVARINNINRWFGTNWKAVPYQYSKRNLCRFDNGGTANIFISCVDTVQARFEIAAILKSFEYKYISERTMPFYWMDLGNSKYTGQIILSTIGSITQPESKQYNPVASLPYITDEFGSLLKQSEGTDLTPSCSLREALYKQDLFINPTLAQFGGEQLWQLLRYNFVSSRGLFLNLKDLRSTPIPLKNAQTNPKNLLTGVEQTKAA